MKSHKRCVIPILQIGQFLKSVFLHGIEVLRGQGLHLLWSPVPSTSRGTQLVALLEGFTG